MSLKKIFSTKLVLLVLLLLVAVIAVPVSATDTPLFSIPGKTTVVFPNDGVSMFRSVDYGPLDIPEGLLVSSMSDDISSQSSNADEASYTLVTFDDVIPVRSNSISIPITLYGIDYTIFLEKMNFDPLNDGIDSYQGSIPGIDNSVVIITVGDDNIFYGSIQLPDDYIEIYPVQDRDHSLRTTQLLHVIYSQKDVVYNETSDVSFCGVDSTIDGIGLNFHNDDVISSLSNDLGEYDWAYINVLVVTDTEFYSMVPNWKVSAQQYMAQANYYFQRPDIKVVLSVIDYDDSKMSDISNHPSVKTQPWGSVSSVYLNNALSARNVDICLYLGGYDVAQDDYLGYAMTRHAWAQMKARSWGWFSPYDGSAPSRHCIIIHELGHMLRASHDYAYSWDVQDGSFWGYSTKYSVMTEGFRGSNHLCEFSSSNPSYHGDAFHDNAKYIRLAKHNVSRYRNSVL
ncbi:zinc-dependent metalloprotease family protein [Methanorbis rubei]|uniref:Peptidase M12B domain-containing protein n=1 Tax=Methanorbis rubei TaxID=3028300 RepID=A0AAE4SD37_9EURY|nr:hypothetical protein [Methanocorpusculaceae archaeon Cs1]